MFILTGIREERDRTGSTDVGVVEGVGQTGRLVIGAALIMFFAFAALSTGPETDLKIAATAFGAGIMPDPEPGGLLAVIPLIFTSSTFVPVATFPGWRQAFAKASPITVAPAHCGC